MQDFRLEYDLWKNDPYFSEDTRNELAGIDGNEEEIFERFYQNLSFGTAGLRGILGAGTNRMNEYTVAQAAEGFARYLDTLPETEKMRGVAISYDSRLRSQEFAEISASILASHNIPSYLMDELRPVPLLSFAIRAMNCIGGIMVTASHNPAKYNGYKVYGEDGSQLPPEHADEVAKKMAEIQDYRTLTWEDILYYDGKDLIHKVGKEVDDAYMEYLHTLSINPEIVKKHSDMQIVYTPLHGSGNKPVRRILQEIGFENVHVVPEQELPDGHFPTVEFPNPEERSALQMAIDLAKEKQASLVIATDPDADRTGLAVLMPDGNYQVMTGNQIGLLLLEYILSSKAKNNTLDENSFAVTTIVSSRLVKKICERYGVELYITLTGFKYIGEKIKELDEEGDKHFQFGYEESFGYLAGTKVRDKDAVVASMLLAELAAVCAEDGKTLYDRMMDIYREYAFGAEQTISIMAEGAEGKKNIAKAMAKLRNEKTSEIAGIPVSFIQDYVSDERLNTQTGEIEKMNMPESNVLLYEINDLDWMCVRPSGTEPKIKVYFGAYDKNTESAEARKTQYMDAFAALVKSYL